MRFTAQQGRLSIHLRVFRQGRDLQVLCGGGATHIGAVALAAPAHGQVEAQSHLAGLLPRRWGLYGCLEGARWGLRPAWWGWPVRR